MAVLNTISFIVPGDPVAQQRHRSALLKDKKGDLIFKGGKPISHNYDPSTNDKKDFIAKCLNHRPKLIFMNPIILNAEFYIKRPKAHYGTGKNANVIKPNAPHKHVKKPDLDNMLKLVKDAMTGIFWHDDNQVYAITASKFYVGYEAPFTKITIKEVTP